MKSFCRRSCVVLFLRLIVVLFFAFAAPPQSYAQGASTVLNGVILKLFGKHDNFAVDSEFQLMDENQKPTITLTLSIAVGAGKMRADANMATAKGPAISPEDIAQAKAAGQDRVISILRQDKGRMFILYPARRSYEDAILPKELASVSGLARIQKTPLGKETIDGHPCIKNKVVLTDDKGRKQEMIAWEASDLKEFPIKVKLSDGGQNWIVHNRNIRFGKIDVVHFDVPAGFTRMAPKK